MRNRWYDPQTGRFLSQDPNGLAGGVNLYAYAGNNPASFSDPFGLCKKGDVDCRLVVNFLRKQSGSEFKAAADRYDATTTFDVHLVAGNDQKLRSYNADNRDGDPSSWTHGLVEGSDVYLNGNTGKGDFLIAAVHESYHFGEGVGPDYVGDNASTLAQAEYRAYGQLSKEDRKTAPQNAAKFYGWWGKGYGEPLPEGFKEPTE
jgi:uncharacterized protein RhaS with RHS repeats